MGLKVPTASLYSDNQHISVRFYRETVSRYRAVSFRPFPWDMRLKCGMSHRYTNMIFEYIYDALLYMSSFGAVIVLVFSLVMILVWLSGAALRVLLVLLR
jgi:hypothetical protein